MARKIKQGLDYFPHACNYDDELKYIIALHKEVGYYVYFEILKRIYSDNGYYMNADKKYLVLFANEINVNINDLNVIINDCLSEHLFHKGIHKSYLMLTSRGIQERYFEAVKRRKELELINDYILLNNVDILLNNVSINWLNVDKSTQSKVKKSKEDIIIKYSEFYDNEILISNDDKNYIKFIKILFGENNSGLKLTGVLKLKNQLTFKQFQLIYAEKKKLGVSLTTVLENLENRTDLLKKYSMLQRVLLNWMKTNKK